MKTVSKKIHKEVLFTAQAYFSKVWVHLFLLTIFKIYVGFLFPVCVYIYFIFGGVARHVQVKHGGWLAVASSLLPSWEFQEENLWSDLVKINWVTVSSGSYFLLPVSPSSWVPLLGLSYTHLLAPVLLPSPWKSVPALCPHCLLICKQE